jgi:hypothetical protein
MKPLKPKIIVAGVLRITFIVLILISMNSTVDSPPNTGGSCKPVTFQVSWSGSMSSFNANLNGTDYIRLCALPVFLEQ